MNSSFAKETEYFHKLGTALIEQDADSSAKLLSMVFLNDEQKRRFCSLVNHPNFSNILQQNIPFDYQEIVSGHMRGYLNFINKDYIGAFDIQHQVSTAIFDIMMDDKDSNWWLKLIDVIISKLRIYSYYADPLSKHSTEGSIVEAQNVFKRFFGKMIIDRSPLQISKKMGGLIIIVHLLKIYFRLNNLRLCTNLVKTVHGPSFPKFEFFPKSQTIAYSYYLGRLMIFEEKFDRASEALQYAFDHCHKNSFRNKKRILDYLIPLKIIMGKFPTQRLLEKYDLSNQFLGLIQSVKSGQLNSFNECINLNRNYFIHKGIYLLLEKSRTYVFRNLFKKVHSIQRNYLPEVQQNKLKLKLLLKSLYLNGSQMDEDELECILANLIYNGLIRGYIAHGNCVVVSKADPFPYLSTYYYGRN